jgi:apolipoprotein N-acyltransferase
VDNKKIKERQKAEGKRQEKYVSVLQTSIGFILSAGLLTFCQAPWGLSFLAWFALVPFAIVCKPQISKKTLILAAYIVSFVYWLGNLYWIIPITGPGYVCFAMGQAMYWPLLALGVRYLRAKNWPMMIALPILFVGAESVQSFLFTGFNWYFPAHSQYANTSLIQIADMFGTFGISALIAMVNGVLVDGIKFAREKKGRWYLVFEATTAVVLILATFLYGRQALGVPPFVSLGRIGVVQTNVPSAVKEETENAQAILDDLFKQSDQCIAAGAKMVVWPETMVLTTLNPGYRMYCDPNSEPVRFNRQIAEYAGRTQSYLLVGATANWM